MEPQRILTVIITIQHAEQCKLGAQRLYGDKSNCHQQNVLLGTGSSDPSEETAEHAAKGSTETVAVTGGTTKTPAPPEAAKVLLPPQRRHRKQWPRLNGQFRNA